MCGLGLRAFGKQSEDQRPKEQGPKIAANTPQLDFFDLAILVEVTTPLPRLQYSPCHLGLGAQPRGQTKHGSSWHSDQLRWAQKKAATAAPLGAGEIL
mmetsp:Transcript_8033/g.22802  ORF Transcript_8033/g.22802 Transcript_8033/m.22802 type:complete len:98 (-) Transcript_8033:415-708(-)